MSAGNVWFEQDRFGKKVALNTKIVPVDNDSFALLQQQSFFFNCCASVHTSIYQTHLPTKFMSLISLTAICY